MTMSLRNSRRIKTTQPISMILVSFFLEDNVLSDGEEEQKYHPYFGVSKQRTSSVPLFFWTPGIIHVGR